MSLQKYNVTGMSCANKVPGVESVAVSLLTNSMGVEGTADAGEIVRAVENAGYGAVLLGGAKAGTEASAKAGAAKAKQQEQAAEADAKEQHHKVTKIA